MSPFWWGLPMSPDPKPPSPALQNQGGLIRAPITLPALACHHVYTFCSKTISDLQKNFKKSIKISSKSVFLNLSLIIGLPFSPSPFQVGFFFFLIAFCHKILIPQIYCKYACELHEFLSFTWKKSEFFSPQEQFSFLGVPCCLMENACYVSFTQIPLMLIFPHICFIILSLNVCMCIYVIYMTYIHINIHLYTYTQDTCVFSELFKLQT